MQVKNISLTVFRFLSRTFLGLVAFTVFVQPAFADHILVFTENSSTSLSVTFDGITTGITVNNVGLNVWNVFLPAPISNAAINWIEPEDNTLVNFVVSNGSNRLLVRSDADLYGGVGDFPLVADGTFVAFGTYAGDGAAIQAVFYDRSDSTSVPEPTSLALLGTGIVGLGLVRRRIRS